MRKSVAFTVIIALAFNSSIFVLLLLGKISGAVTAILILLGLIGEPFLDQYIETKMEEARIMDSSKVKLRKLLSDKMGVDEDDVHIEIGKMYRDVKNINFEIKRNHNTLTIY